MSKITYTQEARKYGIEGKLLIQAEIDEDGNVTGTKLINKLGYGLDEIVEKATKNTKFKPAIKNGNPVQSKVLLPITFILTK